MPKELAIKSQDYCYRRDVCSCTRWDTMGRITVQRTHALSALSPCPSAELPQPQQGQGEGGGQSGDNGREKTSEMERKDI